MKKFSQLIFTLSLASTFTISSSAIYAATLDCAAKKVEIENQIGYAKKYNNADQVAGLESALANITQNCSDTGLLEKKAQQVADKQREVLKRENDLAEAKRSGNNKKIAKQQQKLQKAIEALNKAKA